MANDTSALSTGITLESVAHRPLLTRQPSSRRLKRRLLAVIFAQVSNEVSRRSPTWSARSTRSSTTHKSRPMCNAVGSTSRTQASAPSTRAKQARRRCRCLTTRTRCLWARASTQPRNSMTLSERSAAFARMSPCPRMRPLRGSEDREHQSASSDCQIKPRQIKATYLKQSENRNIQTNIQTCK